MTRIAYPYLAIHQFLTGISLSFFLLESVIGTIASIYGLGLYYYYFMVCCAVLNIVIQLYIMQINDIHT